MRCLVFVAFSPLLLGTGGCGAVVDDAPAPAPSESTNVASDRLVSTTCPTVVGDVADDHAPIVAFFGGGGGAAITLAVDEIHDGANAGRPHLRGVLCSPEDRYADATRLSRLGALAFLDETSSAADLRFSPPLDVAPAWSFVMSSSDGSKEAQEMRVRFRASHPDADASPSSPAVYDATYAFFYLLAIASTEGVPTSASVTAARSHLEASGPLVRVGVEDLGAGLRLVDAGTSIDLVGVTGPLTSP